MLKLEEIVKTGSFRNLMLLMMAILSIILFLSATIMPGCKPYGQDNAISDIGQDNKSKKDGTETTGKDGTAEVSYKNAPQDFGVQLKWNTGSLPPPYNYSYGIYFGPGLSGRFEYQGGNGLPEMPKPWTTDFEISAGIMDDLYMLMEKNDFFRDKWEKSEPSIGGSSTIITVNANGTDYKIPPDFELKHEDVQKINEVADYINSMVPKTIWEQMQRQQSELEKSYEE